MRGYHSVFTYGIENHSMRFVEGCLVNFWLGMKYVSIAEMVFCGVMGWRNVCLLVIAQLVHSDQYCFA